MRRHSKRQRQDGPGHPLVVMYCSTHGCYFTVYPLGWYPYARRPVPQIMQVLQDVLDGKEVDTIFGYVFAAQSQPWSAMEGQRRQHTRQLAYAATYLGLSAPEADFNALHDALGVDVGVLKGARTQYAETRYWQERARTMVHILDAMLHTATTDEELLRRLLHVGYVSGKVGQAWWIDADSGGLYATFPRRNAEAETPMTA